MKRAIVTVMGKDSKGIIAAVSGTLFLHGVNILDISQTLLAEYSTMAIMADLTDLNVSFHELKEELDTLGKALNISVNIQREELFNAMNKV